MKSGFWICPLLLVLGQIAFGDTLLGLRKHPDYGVAYFYCVKARAIYSPESESGRAGMRSQLLKDLFLPRELQSNIWLTEILWHERSEEAFNLGLADCLAGMNNESALLQTLIQDKTKLNLAVQISLMLLFRKVLANPSASATTVGSSFTRKMVFSQIAWNLSRLAWSKAERIYFSEADLDRALDKLVLKKERP